MDGSARMSMPDEDLTPQRPLDPDERDIEAPDADAQEQATPADPADGQPEPRVGYEVDEFDALEQARVVEAEDDYR